MSQPISVRIPPELLHQVDELASRTGKARSETIIDLLRAAMAPLPEPELPPADLVIKRLGRLDETMGRLLYHLLGTTPEPEDIERSVELADQRMTRMVEQMERGSIWRRFGG